MRIILGATQSAITNEEIHVSNESHFKQLLSILQDGSVKHIQLDAIAAATLLDLNLVHDLGRVLSENGTLTVASAPSFGESDKAFFNFLFAGAYLNETAHNTFTKQTIKSLSLVQVKDLGQVFGEYDYLKQTFKPLQKNKFQDIQQTEDLIDEDSLISDTIEIKKVENCTTKAKACKNCNCGRKENEQNLPKEELIKQLQEGTIKSSCGSCYLGDAFRCANCPYKGLPAFKQGEKVQVNNLTEQVVQLEQSNTQIQGGKVKIAL